MSTWGIIGIIMVIAASIGGLMLLWGAISDWAEDNRIRRYRALVIDATHEITSEMNSMNHSLLNHTFQGMDKWSKDLLEAAKKLGDI